MEALQQIGFKFMTPDAVQELQFYNAELTPILERYKGMGWYQVISEYHQSTEEARYVLVDLGGANGYEVKDNFETYAEAKTPLTRRTLLDVLEEVSGEGYVEIVGVQMTDSGIIQQTVDVGGVAQ